MMEFEWKLSVDIQRFQPFRTVLPLLVEIWASRSFAFSGMSLYGIGLAVNGMFQKWKHWDHSTRHLERKCFYWKRKLDVVRKGFCFLFRILGIFISLAWPSCVYEKKNSGKRKWKEVSVPFKTKIPDKRSPLPLAPSSFMDHCWSTLGRPPSARFRFHRLGSMAITWDSALLLSFFLESLQQQEFLACLRKTTLSLYQNKMYF